MKIRGQSGTNAGKDGPLCGSVGDHMEGGRNMFKKIFKFLVWTGVLAGAAAVALQFEPVRDAVKKLGVDL